MIDFNNLPTNIDKQVFNACGNAWQSWTKPSKCSVAYIVCIGGGGGGGNGQGGIAGTARFSGAGGGSSAVTIALVPFYLIPDTLYINVALGGESESNGGISYVSFYPTIDMYNCLLINGTAAGAGAPAVVGGSGGAALTTSSTTNPRYLSLCSWSSYAGQTGASTASFSGLSVTALSSSITTSGASGAGVPASNLNGPGGDILSGDSLTSLIKNLSGGSTSGGAGRDGYNILKPFFSVGGSGGGGNPSGTGGAGGNANIGSGGGGGGCGLTLGVGGKGGNGLVMIISY